MVFKNSVDQFRVLNFKPISFVLTSLNLKLIGDRDQVRRAGARAVAAVRRATAA